MRDSYCEDGGVFMKKIVEDAVASNNNEKKNVKASTKNEKTLNKSTFNNPHIHQTNEI